MNPLFTFALMICGGLIAFAFLGMFIVGSFSPNSCSNKDCHTANMHIFGMIIPFRFLWLIGQIGLLMFILGYVIENNISLRGEK